MRRRLIATLVSLLMVLALVQVPAIESYAATGESFSEAVEVTFMESYNATWSTSSGYYYKINVTEQGILDVAASRPYNSKRGKYEDLWFKLYDSSGNIIWGNQSMELSTTYMTYIYSVGVDAGIYYMEITPRFFASSSNTQISSTVMFDLIATQYAEIEPNDNKATANAVTVGEVYTGFLGCETSNYDRYDYWSVYLEEGKSYAFSINNYISKLSNTTMIFHLITPSGKIEYLSVNLQLLNADILQYNPDETGTYYFEVYNYSQKQKMYIFGFKDLTNNDSSGDSTNSDSNTDDSNTGSNNDYTNDTSSNDSNTTNDSSSGGTSGSSSSSGGSSSGSSKNGRSGYSNEWVNGKWFNANGTQTYGPTLTWKYNGYGWWVEDSSGWYPTSKWQKIDGYWYYFNASGYMASGEWVDGWWCNNDGSCTYGGVGSWHYSAGGGWWYGDSTGWYASSTWQKIDGYWYYFKGDGYMATNQYVDGYWLGADGVCR